MPKPVPPTEFTPTGVVSLDDLLSGVVDPTVVAPPAPPVKPPVVAVSTPPPSPEPEDGPADFATFVPETAPEEPSRSTQVKPAKNENNAMRQQLEKLAREKEASDAEVARLKQEYETSGKDLNRTQAELDSIRAEHERLTAKVSVGNPMAHPDIRKITEPWNSRIPQLATQLRESGVKVQKLDQFLSDRIAQYLDAGDPEGDQFVDKMEALRDEVDRFTGGIRRDSDRSSAQEKLMTLIRDGAQVGHRVRETISAMQANAPMFHYREQLAVYENEAREYESIERDFFTPTEDLRMGDPLHQKVILSAMIEGSEEVKRAAQNAKLFSRIISLPPKPLNPQELEQVDPSKRQEAQLIHLSRHNEAKKKAVKLIPEALVAYAVLPALWNELETLRKRVAGERGAPKPRGGGSQRKDEEEINAPITEFTPTGVDPNTLPL